MMKQCRDIPLKFNGSFNGVTTDSHYRNGASEHRNSRASVKAKGRPFGDGWNGASEIKNFVSPSDTVLGQTLLSFEVEWHRA